MRRSALFLQARTFRNLRRHRNFRVFFAGQVVSLAGSWMQNVALAWLVLSLSRSPLAVAALLFCRFAPYTVLGLFAGSIVDRFDPRRLVIGAQTAAMGASIALAAVTLGGVASLPVVYALAALGGVTIVVDAPARQALTYRLVGPRELPNAVALNSGLLNASRVIGPALAGVVIAAAGTGACFVLNAVSFLAVLAALLMVRTDDLHPVDPAPPVSLASGTREGMRYAWTAVEVRAVLTVVVVTGLVGFNFNTLVPLLAADTLHVGARAFGLLSAAFGIGALVGALASATLRGASWSTFVAGGASFSVLLLVLAPVHDARLAGVLLVGIGASFSLFGANANALVQLAAPDALRGRMIGLYLFAFVGLAPLGALLAGWLVTLGGTELAFAVAGLTGLVAIAVASRIRALPAAASAPA